MKSNKLKMEYTSNEELNNEYKSYQKSYQNVEMLMIGIPSLGGFVLGILLMESIGWVGILIIILGFVIANQISKKYIPFKHWEKSLQQRVSEEKAKEHCRKSGTIYLNNKEVILFDNYLVPKIIVKDEILKNYEEYFKEKNENENYN